MSAAPRRIEQRIRRVAALAVGVLLLTLPAGLPPATAAPLDAATVEAATVEAELAPDGEIVRAWVRRYERDGDGAMTAEHVEEIEEARIPIAVRVVYELDGEQVTGRQLQGATGEAVIRIQLRNPTTEPRTVTRPNGGEQVEVDLSVPMTADGLLELDDTWQDVRSDAGRLAPGGAGVTRLRWSAALFEPFADATSQIEVRGRVDDASLPRLEVDARPVTAASSDLLRVLEERATELTTSDAVAAFIAENLGEGLSGAAEGAEGLAGGLVEARTGAGEIAAALQQLQDELGGGLGELEEGLDRLDEGLAGVAQGLVRVEDGLADVVEGLHALRDGIAEARHGAASLRDEVARPAEDAVREAWEILGERFTVGRLDPDYVDALLAVGELHALLTGEAPATDDLDEMPGDEDEQEELAGLLDQVAELTGQERERHGDVGELGQGAEDLDDYPGLAASLDALAEGLGEASEGANELAEAVEGIAGGLTDIRGGVREMRAMLDDAAPDAGPGEGDPAEMEAGLAAFEDALRQLADGGGELAGGIDALGEGGDELVERLERGLDAANLDLATLEALSERALEPMGTGERDAPGSHERYLLVLHEPRSARGPVAALVGLGMLGLTLEVLRRRLTAAP